MFFNDILPYASVNESRDAWHRKLYDLAAPLVADCQTPAEVAQRLNQKLFKLTGLRYSTQRRRPDQGPLETMESGVATCTRLSIMLVDACRAVGVPRDLTWLMTDKVIEDFFWLRCDAPGKQRETTANCRDNRLTVTTTTNITAASVLLDRRLVDFDKPVDWG